MNKNTDFFTPSESQIIKAISIIAVILLHGLTLFSGDIYFSKPINQLIILIDQFFRFCVPTFVFISGYGLARKFAVKKFNLWNHLNKWLLLTIPIYLIWSVYLIWILWWYEPWWSYGIKQNFLQTLIRGEADYHLYFIPMLLQLYLIFPLIWNYGKRHIEIITIIAFGIQLFAFNQYQLLDYGDQFQYLLFSSWIGYFCLGVWFAIKSPKTYYKYVIRILLVISLVLLYQNATVLLEKTNNIVFSMRTTKPMVMLYSFLFLYALSSSSIRLKKFEFLQVLGEYSLVLYLSHTLVIRYIKTPFNGFFENVIGIGSFLFVVAISIWWQKYASKFRLS